MRKYCEKELFEESVTIIVILLSEFCRFKKEFFLMDDVNVVFCGKNGWNN